MRKNGLVGVDVECLACGTRSRILTMVQVTRAILQLNYSDQLYTDSDLYSELLWDIHLRAAVFERNVKTW